MRVRGSFASGATALVVAATILAGCSGSSKRELVGFVPPDETSTTATTTRPTTTRPSTTATTGASAAATTTGPTVAPSAQWTPATGNLSGLPSECGNLSLVSARQDQDMVIASVAQQGLWSSETNAWVHLGQGSGSATITNRGSTIVYDPEHPNTFWESGIYNGNGVYRTDDNGATFRALGDMLGADSVSIDFTDPSRRTLFATSHERTTAFRSSDGGATWTDVSTSLPTTAGNARSGYVIDAHTFLLGTTGRQDGGVFRTTDAGATWTQVFTGDMGAGPLVAKSDGAMYWTVNSGGLIKSNDGGVTWVPAARAATVTPSAGSLIELPDGRLAGIGKQAVIISGDHGATWSSVGPAIPYPPTGLAYSPARKAFYTWYFTCDRNGANTVPADAIMTLAFDATAAS